MSSRATEILNSAVFAPDHVLLPEISFQAFTYPGDQEALNALKSVPGAGALLTYLQENFTEQLVFVENNEQMIRAGTNSFSSLYRLVERCSAILSLPVPDVFVTSNPVLNAYTVGHRRTCVVLHSALVESMSADELSFVIGHELGHIKCGHGLYRQLGSMLVQYWDAVSALLPIPGLGLLRIPLLLAFWEWYRRAEFTCDRAGLLCVQTPEACLTALGKLAGKINGLEDEFHIESAIAQADAHKDVNKLVLVVSIINAMQNTHPFVPIRLKQLKAYAGGPQYQQILAGQYERDPLGLHEGGARVKCACGAKVNVKLNFCPECGKPVEGDPGMEIAAAATVCGSCGGTLTPGIKFCPGCGAKQDGAIAAAATEGSNSAFGKFKSSAAGFLKRP
ncbi:MAG TPA: M48 family metallopeptidase [Bryobacteraceae bacterium]|jgi:Zn-dependent protease with chaperone function|nr:M48 family metallopeptidase [Bryobacteraceae bacterium]